MPITVIRGTQVKDYTIQRHDLDTSTVGQAVVAKIIQGANVTLSSTGGDSGTGDVTISATGSAGPPGPNGLNAFNITSGAFTVPPIGSTVTVTLNDASWVVIGQMLWIDQSGGGVGQAGEMQVTAKTGNQITLLNVSSTPGGIPLADTTQNGLLARLSGASTDYVGGDNACHGLAAAVPTGVMLDFAGTVAPNGYALCDGTSYATTGAMANLFAVIGYAWGGSGANFNVPDFRGRGVIGAGAGTGLTARTLAATGGEETHVLAVAELSAHSHTMGNHYHYCPGADHEHDLQNHQHYSAGVDHLHSLLNHQHIIRGSSVYPSGGGTLAANNFGAVQWWDFSGTSAVTVSAADRSLAQWSQGPNINNTGFADRSLAFNSGGPSTNTSDGTGSSTAHNTMMPFGVATKIIKT